MNRNKSFLDMTILLTNKYEIEYEKVRYILKTENEKLRALDFNELIENGEIDEYARDIYKECLDNPWYFFREVLRVPDQGETFEYTKCNNFSINEGTLCALLCYTNDLNFILETPRQTGKGLFLAGIMIYEGLIKGNFDNRYYDLDHYNKKAFVGEVNKLIELNSPILSLFPSYKDYYQIFTAELQDNISIRKEEVSETGRGFHIGDAASIFVGNLEYYMKSDATYIKNTIRKMLINGGGKFQHFYAESSYNGDPDDLLTYLLDYGLPQLNIRTMKRLFDDRYTYINILKNLTNGRPVRIRFGGIDMISTRDNEDYILINYNENTMNSDFYLKRN